jgi:monovalent cation/hydrogen antiporter
MGESIVNDAVSIVLYRTACGFVASGESANAASLGAAAVTLTIIFVGSVAVGLFSSLVGTSMIMVAERQHGASSQLAQLQTALVLMFAYVAFEGAESLHFSGIIAALAAGVASKHYAFPHMCKEGRMLSKMTFPMVATLFETVIFFLCGVSVSQFLHIM